MNHVDTTKTITHLSLCTGYEGIGLGLRRVLPDVREIAYVEIEAFAIANLANKIEKGWLDEAPIYTNLKTFPYRKFRGRVDILSGGFPCQGFSHAGNKKGVDDPRHLFPFIAKGITECRPRIVFLENVEGIISSKTHEGESVLQYVLRTLEEMGYRAEAGVFSASEVGAPHQRKRVFILGISNSEIERCRGWESGDDCDREWVQESSEEKQSNVWGEAEGCSRDNGELANTDSSRRGQDRLSAELWTDRTEQSSNDSGDSEQTEGRKGSQEELGNSESRCDRLNKTESQGWNTTSTTSEGKKLGNTTSIRLSRSGQESREVSTDSEGEECRLYESQGAGALSNDESFEEGLSDTDNEGLEGSLSEGESRKEPKTLTARCSRREYPSRPNEEQYEWEEPRVIKAKPRLGGATDGTASRVDRLRLLGNGVVPDTAAKAFTTLTKRIIE